MNGVPQDAVAASAPPKAISASDVAAGGGGGGILVYLVTSYVPDPKLQGLLLYLVPAVTIVVTGIYSGVVSFLLTRSMENAAEKKRKQLLEQAKISLEEARQYAKSIEADSNATTSHKRKMRENVQALEQAVFALHTKGVITLSPTSGSEPDEKLA